MLVGGNNMKFKMIVCLIPFLLSACSKTSVKPSLEKTNDTNLNFWITQKVTYEEMKEKGCTYLREGYAVGEYVFLDSDYTLPEDQPEILFYKLPEKCVVYDIGNYPRGNSGTKAITYIYVSDPEITVYGLTINSSEEEIDKRMKKIAGEPKSARTYQIENVTFKFYWDGIYIEAEVKDKQIIVY